MSANILRGCAASCCDRTFAVEHGGSLPGGPFPGTYGSEGDVRRCEHGKLWIFDRRERPGTIDTWQRLYPIERAWWRARRLLRDDRPSWEHRAEVAP